MSTTFYGYRCKESDLFYIAQYLRDNVKIPTAFPHWNTVPEWWSTHIQAEMQIFKVDGRCYFRLLAGGSYEKALEKCAVVKPYWYDDRSDAPSWMKFREHVVEEIDYLIRNRQYYIVPVRSKDDTDVFERYSHYWALRGDE